MPRPIPLLLVVDDDPAIRSALAEELAAAGYEVLQAADGERGAALAERADPDLVITDLAMPGLDGFALVRRLRRRSTVPILVLSVRGAEEDKVRALDLGADDYVTKPFSARELIDRGRRRVLQGGREVRLTPTELAILELLAARAGRPVSIAQIVGVVWRGAPATTADTVRVHVGSLRRKLEPDRANPRYIATEPWIGYRFLPEPLD